MIYSRPPELPMFYEELMTLKARVINLQLNIQQVKTTDISLDAGEWLQKELSEISGLILL